MRALIIGGIGIGALTCAGIGIARSQRRAVQRQCSERAARNARQAKVYVSPLDAPSWVAPDWSHVPVGEYAGGH